MYSLLDLFAHIVVQYCLPLICVYRHVFEKIYTPIIPNFYIYSFPHVCTKHSTWWWHVNQSLLYDYFYLFNIPSQSLLINYYCVYWIINCISCIKYIESIYIIYTTQNGIKKTACFCFNVKASIIKCSLCLRYGTLC